MNSHNRRQFLRRIGAMGAASTVYPLLGRTPDIPVPEEIITRKLGRTNIKLPIVSMGVMNATNPGVVAKSYDKGVRHFDTAWYYQGGRNETMLGKVFSDMNIRDNIIIASKVWLKEKRRDLFKKEIKQLFLDRFHESLERLQTDYVDILYYHGAYYPGEAENKYILEAFEQLKDEGKIRHAGISTHADQAPTIDRSVELGIYDVVLAMYNYTYRNDKKLIDSLKNAHKEGIGIIAMKTQCGGRYPDDNPDPSTGAPIEEPFKHTAMLKWALRNDFITTAVPGYETYSELDQNFSVASNLELTTKESAYLESEGVLLSQSFCRDCKECNDQCKQQLDINQAVRYHMYASQYRNIEHARLMTNKSTLEKTVNQCLSCNDCSVSCANNINIRGRIAYLKDYYV